MSFKKTDIQRQAIDVLSSSSKYVALFGGSRSGKTFILIYAIIIRASKEKSRHAIIRHRFNAVKRSVWRDTLPKVLRLCFPKLKPKWNNTDFILELPNGSEIMMLGLDDAERTEKILGLEFSTIYFNESSQIDYSSVQTAISRLAEKNELKKRVWFDFNPPKKNHWSYYLFIKKLEPIDGIPLKSPNDYDSLKMNPKQNLENIDADYIALLEGMPEKERARFLDGEFTDESDGQAYYSFREDEHVKPTEIQYGTKIIGMDFNVSPFCSIMVQYLGGVFFVHDETCLDVGDTYRMCDALKKKNLEGSIVIPDSTGANRKTSGKSDFNILRENGFTIESTTNPFVLDRVNNVNRLLAAGRIIINPKCKKLINDLHKVSWKNNELDQSGASKDLTHVSDCLGYVCWKLDPIVSFKKNTIEQQSIR